MVKITDLRSYKESDDFKNIISKFKNKIEGINKKIDAAYEAGEVDNEPKWSEHDVQFNRKKFILSIMDEVKIKTVGSEAFLEDLKKQAENAWNFLKVRIQNEYGWLYSAKIYTDLDLERRKAASYHFVESFIDDMIAELEKEPEVKEEEIY